MLVINDGVLLTCRDCLDSAAVLADQPVVEAVRAFLREHSHSVDPGLLPAPRQHQS